MFKFTYYVHDKHAIHIYRSNGVIRLYSRIGPHSVHSPRHIRPNLSNTID